MSRNECHLLKVVIRTLPKLEFQPEELSIGLLQLSAKGSDAVDLIYELAYLFSSTPTKVTLRETLVMAPCD